MRLKPVSTMFFLAGALAFGLAGLRAAAQPAEKGPEMKIEAQLVWGTNETNNPARKLKPVSPELEEKLRSSPFKWERYFEITNREVSVREFGSKSVVMSKNCQLEIKNLGESQVQMRIIGRGKPVGKITQVLPKHQLLITGGNAENKTAWFVVLKQVE
jgi:hypothetical protein